MKGPYFVIAVGRSSEALNGVWSGGPLTSSEAHDEARKAYRKENNLASSVALHTLLVYETKDLYAAAEFRDRFMEALKKDLDFEEKGQDNG